MNKKYMFLMVMALVAAMVMNFGVMADTGKSVSGRLTPLRSDIRPPVTTRTRAWSGDVSSAIRRSLPSSSNTSSPGFTSCGNWV